MRHGDNQIVMVNEFTELLLVTVCPCVHHLFASEFKARVFCLMCIRGRMCAANSPQLPMEIWLDLFGFLADILNGRMY
jgi:hypothetical protein